MEKSSVRGAAIFVAFLLALPAWIEADCMVEFPPDHEFGKLLAGRHDVDLVHLMLEFAEDAYPNLDRLACVMEIDRLSVACDPRNFVAIKRPDVRTTLTAVSRVLYDIEGFHGNREAYYEAQNSYLNDVLTRRCGIPISLGILYMAVAGRLGLKMFGANTPGHFVIGCQTESDVLFVDPFTGGDILDRESCKRRIEQMLGQAGAVANEHFRPATVPDVAARVLRNLKAAHAMTNSWREALVVQRRLAALLPQFPQERRDLGLIYLRVGQPKLALQAFEDYKQNCGSQESAALEHSIRVAQKMLVELN